MWLVESAVNICSDLAFSGEYFNQLMFNAALCLTVIIDENQQKLEKSVQTDTENGVSGGQC